VQAGWQLVAIPQQLRVIFIDARIRHARDLDTFVPFVEGAPLKQNGFPGALAMALEVQEEFSHDCIFHQARRACRDRYGHGARHAGLCAGHRGGR
jgi:hypothetical protein